MALSKLRSIESKSLVRLSFVVERAAKRLPRYESELGEVREILGSIISVLREDFNRPLAVIEESDEQKWQDERPDSVETFAYKGLSIRLRPAQDNQAVLTVEYPTGDGSQHPISMQLPVGQEKKTETVSVDSIIW